LNVTNQKAVRRIQFRALVGALFLAAARPNPARAAAVLRFGLPRAAEVSLAVYDVGGREVRELARTSFPAGERDLTWDLKDRAGVPVAGGLFFIRLRADLEGEEAA